MPIDPGDHTIVVSATGKRSWTKVAHIPVAATVQTIAVPVLEDALDALPVPQPIADDRGPAHLVPDPSLRLVGIAVVGAGLVGLAVGTAFGVDAMTKLNDSNSPTGGRCVPAGAVSDCNAAGVQDRTDAMSAATISTVSFAIGSAAVVGGALLYVFAPKVSKKTTGARVLPMVGARSGGMVVAGEW
jgi:uncharacterized protein YjeT (DUF2065 family)